MNGRNVRQGDLVLLSYPFSNLEDRKVRPALVISNNLFNNKSDDCIMVPLTGIIKNEPYSVIINQGNLDDGRLIKLSRIRVDKIFSVEKRLIRLRIGRLNRETFEKVKREFLSLI
ncbi:MAG: type II toxin-antitoxin system PemK/MazF family toxin [Nanoarchaeota archaeon]